MRLDRFGGILLATGAIVGVIAVVGLSVGFEPSQLPPKLLDIAAYKLTFGAAAALLAVGAIVRRYSKTAADDTKKFVSQGSISHELDSPPAQLPPPAVDRDFGAGRVGQKRADTVEVKAPRDR